MHLSAKSSDRNYYFLKQLRIADWFALNRKFIDSAYLILFKVLDIPAADLNGKTMLDIFKTDPTQLPRSQVFAWTMLVSSFSVTVSNTIFAIISEEPSSELYVAWLIPVFALAVAIWTFRTRSHIWPCRIVVTAVFLIFTFFAANTGGVDGYSAPFFVVLPIVVSYFMGMRSMLIFSGILFTVLTALYFADIAGGVTEKAYTEEKSRSIALLVLTTSTLFAVLVTAAFSWRLANHAKNLTEERKRADAANVAKSQFLANMSHEIRTPMNGVLGMAQLLQQSALDEKQEVYAKTIYSSGTALLAILNDILDFSKIEAGKLELESAPFNLLLVVEEVATLFSPSANEKGVEMLFRYKPDLPEMVIGDVGRIRQVLTNLVGNAVKFTHKGHILIDVSGEATGETTTLKICVEDKGIGIAPDKIDQMFDQFTQEENSTTRKYGGSGLGLSISRSLVTAMGGEISVRSQPGEGSVFCIDLTLPSGDAAATAQEPVDIFKNKQVLIVDDNHTNRIILEEQLALWGASPISMGNGASALSILNESPERFSLALLDYHMPEMDGLELTQTIRANEKFGSLPLIILSSSEDPQSAQKFRDLGVSSILAKPVRKQQLALAASNALSDSGLSDLKTLIDETPPDLDVATAKEVESDRISILVAEDNVVNQMVIKNMIDREKCSVRIVGNGQEACDAAFETSFDLILMDISMPVLDGLEATKTIRAHELSCNKSRTPIVAITAYALKGDRDRVLDAGVDDYLAKPVKLNELRSVIEKWSEKTSVASAS